MSVIKPSITVIIPTFNSWKTLEFCIKSIQEQTLKPYEIIVIDNGSIDDTSKNVKKLFPRVKLVTLGTNTGVSGGRNAGIKYANANTDYLFFFDHDMVADKKLLEALVNVFIIDARIGIVTPKIFYWEDKSRIWSAGTAISLWTGKVVFRGGKDQGQYEKIEEVQIAPAALLVKKEVVKRIGGFDERYFVTYEDTDFCLNAIKKGFKVYYSPEAIAYHKISPKVEDEADRLLSRAYWVGRNRIIFMRKFGKNFILFLLFLPLFCFYYLFLALKTNRIKDWLKFLKGTIEGIFIKL